MAVNEIKSKDDVVGSLKDVAREIGKGLKINPDEIFGNGKNGNKEIKLKVSVDGADKAGKEIDKVTESVQNLGNATLDVVAKLNKGSRNRNRFYTDSIEEATKALDVFYDKYAHPPAGATDSQRKSDKSNLYQMVKSLEAQYGKGKIDYSRYGGLKDFIDSISKSASDRAAFGIGNMYENEEELVKYFQELGEALSGSAKDSLKGVGTAITSALKSSRNEIARGGTEVIKPDDVISTDTQHAIMERMKWLRDRLEEMAKEAKKAKDINDKQADTFMKYYAEFNEYSTTDPKYSKAGKLSNTVENAHTDIRTGKIKVNGQKGYDGSVSEQRGLQDARDKLAGKKDASEAKVAEINNQQAMQSRIQALNTANKLNDDEAKAIDAYMESRRKQLIKLGQAMSVEDEYNKARKLYDALRNKKSFKTASEIIGDGSFSRGDAPESQMLGAITNTTVKNKNDIATARKQLNPEEWQQEQEFSKNQKQREKDWNKATRKFQSASGVPKEVMDSFFDFSKLVKTTTENVEELVKQFEAFAKTKGFGPDSKGNWGKITEQTSPSSEGVNTDTLDSLRKQQEELDKQRKETASKIKGMVKGNKTVDMTDFSFGDIRHIDEQGDLEYIADQLSALIDKSGNIIGQVKILDDNENEITKSLFEIVKAYNSNKLIKGTDKEIHSQGLDQLQELLNEQKEHKQRAKELETQIEEEINGGGSTGIDSRNEKLKEDFVGKWTKGLEGDAQKAAEAWANAYFDKLADAIKNKNFTEIIGDFDGKIEADDLYKGDKTAKSKVAQRRTLLSNLTNGQSITSGASAREVMKSIDADAFAEAEKSEFIGRQIQEFKEYVEKRAKGMNDAITDIVTSITKQIGTGDKNLSLEQAKEELDKQAREIGKIYNSALGWIDPVADAQERLKQKLDELDKSDTFGAGEILEETMEKISIDSTQPEINALIKEAVEELKDSIQAFWEDFTEALIIDSPNKLLSEGDGINTSNLKGKAKLMEAFATSFKDPDEVVNEINSALENNQILDVNAYPDMVKRYVKIVNQKIQDNLDEAKEALEKEAKQSKPTSGDKTESPATGSEKEAEVSEKHAKAQQEEKQSSEELTEQKNKETATRNENKKAIKEETASLEELIKKRDELQKQQHEYEGMSIAEKAIKDRELDTGKQATPEKLLSIARANARNINDTQEGIEAKGVAAKYYQEYVKRGGTEGIEKNTTIDSDLSKELLNFHNDVGDIEDAILNLHNQIKELNEQINALNKKPDGGKSASQSGKSTQQSNNSPKPTSSSKTQSQSQNQSGISEEWKAEKNQVISDTRSKGVKVFALSPRSPEYGYLNDEANAETIRAFGKAINSISTPDQAKQLVDVLRDIIKNSVDAEQAIDKLNQTVASMPEPETSPEEKSESPTQGPSVTQTAQTAVTPSATSATVDATATEEKEKLTQATEKSTKAKKEEKEATEAETEAEEENLDVLKQELVFMQREGARLGGYAEGKKKLAAYPGDKEKWFKATNNQVEKMDGVTTEGLFAKGKASAYYSEYIKQGGTSGINGEKTPEGVASGDLLLYAEQMDSIKDLDIYIQFLADDIEKKKARIAELEGQAKGLVNRVKKAIKGKGNKNSNTNPATTANPTTPDGSGTANVVTSVTTNPTTATTTTSATTPDTGNGGIISKAMALLKKKTATWRNWTNNFDSSMATQDNDEFKKYAEKIIIAYNYFDKLGADVSQYKKLYDKVVKSFLKVEPDVANRDFVEQKLLRDTGETLEDAYARISKTGRTNVNQRHIIGYSLNGEMEQQLPVPTTPSPAPKKSTRQTSAPSGTGQAVSGAPVATGIGQALEGEKSVVESVIDAEKGKIQELESELALDVPQAITKKNEAFQGEVAVVQEAVSKEQMALLNLQRQLDQWIPESIDKKNKAFDASAAHTEEIIGEETLKIDAYKQSIEKLGGLRVEQNTKITSETPIDDRIAQLKEAYEKITTLKDVMNQRVVVKDNGQKLYPSLDTLPDDTYFKKIQDILSSFTPSDLFNLGFDKRQGYDDNGFMSMIERVKTEMPKLQEELRALPADDQQNLIKLNGLIKGHIDEMLDGVVKLIEAYDIFTTKANEVQGLTSGQDAIQEEMKQTVKLTQEMSDEYNKFILLFQETGDANVLKERLDKFTVPQLRELSGIEDLPKYQDKEGNRLKREDFIKNLTKKAIDTYHPEVVDNGDGTYGNVQSIAEKAKVAYEELQKKIAETKDALVALDQKVDEAADVSAIQKEIQALTELLRIMTDEIPPAVEKKNQQFIESTEFIGKEVLERIGQLEEVIGRLVTISDNLNFNIVGIDNLNELDGALDLVKTEFEQTDFKDFNAALATTIEILKDIVNFSIPDGNILDKISAMLEKSNELEDLATILTESTNKINDAFEKLKDQPEMFGDLKEVFTPESKGWDLLLKKIEEAGLAANDVAKIVRNVKIDNNGNANESFNVQDVKGNVRTVAKNSNGALSVSDKVTSPYDELVKNYEDGLKKLDKAKDNDTIAQIREQITEADQALQEFVNKYGIGLTKFNELQSQWRDVELDASIREANNEYEEQIKLLNQVINANTEYNKLRTANTNSKNNAYMDDIRELENKRTQYFANGDKAWKQIEAMHSQGRISDEQYNNAKNIYDSKEYSSGSFTSRVSRDRAQSAEDLRKQKEAYDELFKVARRYAEVIKNIGTKKELAGDKQEVAELAAKINKLNEKISRTSLINKDLYQQFKRIKDSADEYVARMGKAKEVDQFAKDQKQKYVELSKAVAEYVEQRKRLASGKALPTDDVDKAMQAVRNQVGGLGVYRDDEMLKNALSPVKEMQKDLKTIDAVRDQTESYAALTAIVQEYANLRKKIATAENPLQEDIDKANELKEAIDIMITTLRNKFDIKELEQKAVAPLTTLDDELAEIQKKADKAETKNIQAMWQRATKDLEAYLKSAEKVQEIQDQIDSGEKSALGASTEMRNAINKMNANKTRYDESMAKYGQIANPDLFVPQDSNEMNYKSALANSIQSTFGNVDTKSSDWGFEDLASTFRTLTAEADKFYAILYKQDSNKSLTYAELQYLKQLKPRYDDVKEHAQEYREELEKAGNLDLFDNLTDATTQGKTKAIIEDINSLGKALDSAENKAGTTEAFQKWVAETKNEYDKLREEVLNFKWTGNAEEDLKNLQERIRVMKKETTTRASSRDSMEVQKRDVASLDRQMVEWMSKNKRAVGASAEIEKLREKLQDVDSDGALQNIKRKFEDIKKEAIDAGEVGRTFAEKLKGSFGNLARYLLSFASFYNIIGSIKSGITIITELDSALNELRKVSELTKDELREFELQSFDLAEQVGTTSNQIIQSTADWKRLGGVRFIYLPPFYTAMYGMQTT